MCHFLILVFHGTNGCLTPRPSPRHSPRSTANIFMVRSTAKFTTNIWSFLLTSNMRALSGIVSWRRCNLLLTYGRMRRTPSGSLPVGLASAYRFKTHSIHSRWPDYTSVGGFDPRFPQTQSTAAPAGTQFTTFVRYRALEAGPRTFKITTNNYEFTGGLKGNLGEFGDYFKTWNWETGFRYSEDSRVERDGGIVDTNALRQALLDTNPATAFNPFGLYQNSRAVIDKIIVTTTHRGRTSLTLEDWKLFGDLFNLPAGPISFAVGAEHRTERATDQPDPLTSSGNTLGNVTFESTGGRRDVWSTYWEVRLPVTSPAWNLPGFYSLELDYQERFDDFSDFGGTERPKFSVRWQPIDLAVTIRATYSEAYHAPTLSDLFRGVIGPSCRYPI